MQVIFVLTCVCYFLYGMSDKHGFLRNTASIPQCKRCSQFIRTNRNHLIFFLHTFRLVNGNSVCQTI